MPYVQHGMPDVDARDKWQTALSSALARRIAAEQLEKPFSELASRYNEQPQTIARILLSFRAPYGKADDPLVFAYARLLLRRNVFRTSHLLLALLESSHLMNGQNPKQAAFARSGLPSCEERVFNMLTQMYTAKEIAFELHEAHGLVHALTRWMHAITEFEMRKQLESGALHTLDFLSFGMYDATAALILTIMSSPDIRQVGQQPWWQKRKSTIVDGMENFDAHVLQWMHSQLGGRLRALTILPPFLKTDTHGRPVYTDDYVLQSIPDLPVENTRAGLYVWLHACLSARPLTDDLSMLSYFQARYSGNNETIPVDLVVAGFDVLTSILLTKESEQSVRLICSFICNKIPPFLSLLSSFLTPTSPIEACIQMAFISITMDALPPMSPGSSEIRERLKVTRLEFLQACALHSLLSENTISVILQEPSLSLPRVTRQTKEGLMSQCANNIGRLEQYIDDLDGMQGNAGAIAGTIVDTISNLCNTKDTMALKSFCSMLTRRIWAIDIVLQYTTSSGLLFPLCSLLDAWPHDQDQTEFTPAYEEFASILLFVMATMHRYGLQRIDLGLLMDEGFCATYFQSFSISTLPEDLTPGQSDQLATWIEGLYATDESGESSGISDEVMRQCPPQAFYPLVPTLFEQSVLACRSGALSPKTFKGGLELLVEPFLLPSLIGGLSWLIKHSWADHGDSDVLLQVLDRLLKPSSSSQETKMMHRAIMVIVAKPLYASLECLCERRQDKIKQITSLMDTLKPFRTQQRTMEAGIKDLEAWKSIPAGGIKDQLQKSIRDHVSWVGNVGPSTPPSCPHKLFHNACEIIGSERVLDAIVTEVQQQTAFGNGPSALDIATGIISTLADTAQAPLLSLNPVPQQTQCRSLSVRDDLRSRAGDVQALLKLPANEAVALVRLHRRVEAQLVVQQTPQASISALQDHSADQMMAELGLDTDLAATVADTAISQAAQLGSISATDFANPSLASALDANIISGSSAQVILPDDSQDIFGDLNLNLGQPVVQADGSSGLGEQANAEEDIFAGLTDMDLGGAEFDF